MKSNVRNIKSIHHRTYNTDRTAVENYNTKNIEKNQKSTFLLSEDVFKIVLNNYNFY